MDDHGDEITVRSHNNHNTFIRTQYTYKAAEVRNEQQQR
jgi:hypothetical protein